MVLFCFLKKLFHDVLERVENAGSGKVSRGSWDAEVPKLTQ